MLKLDGERKHMQQQCLTPQNKYFGLCLMLGILSVYHYYFLNRFFPIQEGWFQYYAHQINSGKVLYRDFYMYLQPLFPLQIAVLSNLFDNTFILYRYYGLAERLLLAAITYLIVVRFVKPQHAFVATLTGVVVYTSNMQDIIYGYYQTCLLFTILVLYCAIRYYEALQQEENDVVWAAAIGFFSAVAFLYKQSTGLVVPLIILFILVVELWDHNKRHHLLKCLGIVLLAGLGPLLACYSWLFFNNALADYFMDVFGGASSKGSLLSILFSFWTRIITVYNVIIFLLLLGIFFIGKRIKKMGLTIGKQMLHTSFSRMCWGYIGAVSVLFGLFTYYTKDFVSFLFTHQKQHYLFLLFIVAIVLLALYKVFPRRYLLRWPQYNVALLLCGLTVCVLVSMAIWTSRSFSIQHETLKLTKFFDTKRCIVYFAFFYACMVSAIGFLFKVMHKSPIFEFRYWLVMTTAAALMYAHGMSHVVEEHAALPALPIVIGMLLSTKIPWNNFKNVIVGLICLALIVLTLSQKVMSPYWWWGWGEPPIVGNADTVTPKIKELKGFELSAKTNDTLNYVVRLVQDNSSPQDEVFAFPHISLFNVLTARENNSFASVHYFDVCPDWVATKDAKRLLEKPPQIIIWLTLSEEDWIFHEKHFRGGKRSGQRDIEDAVNRLTQERYEKIGMIETINIWKRIQ